LFSIFYRLRANFVNVAEFNKGVNLRDKDIEEVRDGSIKVCCNYHGRDRDRAERGLPAAGATPRLSRHDGTCTDGLARVLEIC